MSADPGPGVPTTLDIRADLYLRLQKRGSDLSETLNEILARHLAEDGPQ